MKTYHLRLAPICLALLACCTAMSQAAWADGLPGATRIVPGERLSDWLLRNAPPGADATALHWRVPAEQGPQQQLRQAVLGALGGDHAALTAWLAALPLTGRLTVAHADARWLQAAPGQDPVLQDGQTVLLLPRPTQVSVVNAQGRICSVPHTSGAFLADYIQACWGEAGLAEVDWAWLAQADGRTAQYGVAPWNQTEQNEPGPGAWIWAPQRTAAIGPMVSDNLIRFLATQLPAENMPAIQPEQAGAAALSGRDAPRNAQLSASDWGEIGLLQTPTARMEPAGAARMQLGRVDPYTRLTMMFQPLDWLEAGFRYTDIGNRLYGASIAGDQTYKDKSIDIKVRLREETHLWPQVAVGVRDLGGTGLFSAEYLVASKRWGNWDASLGLGWGYLGARGSVNNPLGALGPEFNTRIGNLDTTGGTASFQSMFRGPAALFGGVQWHAPNSPWLVKLELDGNDYQHEPLNNNQTASSPFNLGVVYSYSPNIDFSLGVERGNKLMLGFTMHGALNKLQTPKVLDPALPVLRKAAPAKLEASTWRNAARAVELHTGWGVQGITHQYGTATLVAETDEAVHLQERVDRAVKTLDLFAPSTVHRFVLQLQQRGLALSRVEVDRDEWALQQTQAMAPTLRLPVQQLAPGLPSTIAQPVPEVAEPDREPELAVAGYARPDSQGFAADVSPSYSQILGGPDNFLLYQLGVQAKLEQRFSDSTWLAGFFNLRVLDNYGNFVYDAPSELPRVRTLQRKYVTSSRATMPLLQLTDVRDLGNGNYASLYAGMLESMYGGVGGEWLYRPWQSRFAFGVDINRVRQRDFDQNFQFRDYQVTTGHATVYWDTGWNGMQVNLSAGQYLAGDVGATLDVKRIFSNGVSIGAWATKTNVSAEQFGEGSFDKGIYVRIPLDVLSPRSSAGNANIVWNPLTRDGGARLNRIFPLYELTQQRDRRAWSWSSYGKPIFGSAENNAYIAQEPHAHPLGNIGATTRTLGQQIADTPSSTWLWAGGAVLASSLLDSAVDHRVASQTGLAGSPLTKGGNAMPYALLAGTGLLYTGIAGEAASTTAGTAMTAAAYTLGANLLTRYAVGRARPFEERGPGEFNGFTSGATRSGFASNHVATAFALVTPFAQQYDMPWLYAAAATTGLGRIADREHWLSDTVAGAFMGYAIGTMLSDQQLGRYKALRVGVSPNHVEATWSF